MKVKSLDTAVKSLGKASTLYQKLASQIKEQLPKSKYVKTDKNGVVSISRSKEAREKLNINKIISLYNVALKNTVKAEKDKIKEYMKNLSEPHADEPENPKDKIISRTFRSFVPVFSSPDTRSGLVPASTKNTRYSFPLFSMSLIM